MKKILSTAVLMISAFGATAAIAEDVKFTLDPAVSFYSDYMWRGQKLFDGASIQPEVTLTADFDDLGALSGNVWSHVSGDDKNEGSSVDISNGGEDFTEVDYKLDYTLGLDLVSLSLGHIWYTYVNSDPYSEDTAEYYASAAFDVITNPTFTYYRDYDEYDSNYYELNFSHKFEDTCGMGEGFNATPYVTFGFADSNSSVYADGGLVQATVGVSSDMKLGHIDVVPSFHYTFESDDAADSQFWFGVTLGHLFEL